MIQTSHHHLDNVTKNFGRVTAVDHMTLEILRDTCEAMNRPANEQQVGLSRPFDCAQGMLSDC